MEQKKQPRNRPPDLWQRSKGIQRRKDSLSKKGAGTTGHLHGGKTELDTDLTLSQKKKINSKPLMDLNVKHKTATT